MDFADKNTTYEECECGERIFMEVGRVDGIFVGILLDCIDLRRISRSRFALKISSRTKATWFS